MQLSAFCSVLPSMGDYCTIGAYSTAKPYCLTDLHYKVITLSAQIISKVTYGYIIVQSF